MTNRPRRHLPRSGIILRGYSKNSRTTGKYSNSAARHRLHATGAGLRPAPTTGIDRHAPRSHRGGHWFDPSIAHPAQRPIRSRRTGRFDPGVGRNLRLCKMLIRSPSDRLRSRSRSPSDRLRSRSRSPSDRLRSRSRSPSDRLRSRSRRPSDRLRSSLGNGDGSKGSQCGRSAGGLRNRTTHGLTGTCATTSDHGFQ